MNFIPTEHPDVWIVRPQWYGDARGAFAETYNRRVWVGQGFDVSFCQDNHVFTLRAGTVRGLHFQRPPSAQAKLIRVIKGAILDVAVDIRVGSPRYGMAVSRELSAENGLQLFVPVGFAHGYCTLVPETEVLYKVDNHYDPATEGGVLWNDPALAIPWPACTDPETVLDRDRQLPRLRDCPAVFHF